MSAPPSPEETELKFRLERIAGDKIYWDQFSAIVKHHGDNALADDDVGWAISIMQVTGKIIRPTAPAGLVDTRHDFGEFGRYGGTFSLSLHVDKSGDATVFMHCRDTSDYRKSGVVVQLDKFFCDLLQTRLQQINAFVMSGTESGWIKRF